jgi:beta-glucosidase/6-phospho-beta-glucosidase/beta-galactosidase
MKLFRSFFMGGYECADHINRNGDRVNLLTETEHDKRAADDYALLSATGIRTVREGICWSSVEKKPWYYDFREVGERIRAANDQGIQQVWDLCHFGYPDDLMPTHPKFAVRFAALCEMFAEYYQGITTAPLIVTPINEISFLSWHSGDVRGTVPFAVNSGFDIKYHLCKAAIKGIRALREVDPSCRILLTEPLVEVHAAEGAQCNEAVCEVNEHQFQAMDIIGGAMCPELGGSPDYLDILGFNYYHNNQWTLGGEPLAWWPEPCARRAPLHTLLMKAWNRYKRPMVLAETGFYGDGRIKWLQEVTDECVKAMHAGVDLQGICIYPLIDRPDWDQLDSYCKCGLWDLDEQKNRVPCEAYLQALQECIRRIAKEEANVQKMPAQKVSPDGGSFADYPSNSGAQAVNSLLR